MSTQVNPSIIPSFFGIVRRLPRHSIPIPLSRGCNIWSVVTAWSGQHLRAGGAVRTDIGT